MKTVLVMGSYRSSNNMENPAQQKSYSQLVMSFSDELKLGYCVKLQKFHLHIVGNDSLTKYTAYRILSLSGI
jgi:hypothetical protein